MTTEKEDLYLRSLVQAFGKLISSNFHTPQFEPDVLSVCDAKVQYSSQVIVCEGLFWGDERTFFQTGSVFYVKTSNTLHYFISSIL